MPKLLSLGLILSVVGIGYVSHTIHTFYNIYFPPWCSSKRADLCIVPKFLCENSDVVLQIWLSHSANPPSGVASNTTKLLLNRDIPCAMPMEQIVSVDFGDDLPSDSSTYYAHIFVLGKIKGKKLEFGNLRTDNPNVAYQKTVVTKMMEEERTAMNLIKGQSDGAKNSSER